MTTLICWMVVAILMLCSSSVQCFQTVSSLSTSSCRALFTCDSTVSSHHHTHLRVTPYSSDSRTRTTTLMMAVEEDDTLLTSKSSSSSTAAETSISLEQVTPPKAAVKCPDCDLCDGSGRSVHIDVYWSVLVVIADCLLLKYKFTIRRLILFLVFSAILMVQFRTSLSLCRPSLLFFRISGGIGAILDWWPIKAYRPCPNFIERGGSYTRSGQGLDEIAFGRDSKFRK
jgi:hypothetical protein